MKKTLFALACGMMPFASHALVQPQGTAYDRHIQTVTYNPDNVVNVNINKGTVTQIQLGKNEVIKGQNAGMGIGDPEAWDIAVRGNNIWLRPKADKPDTNLSFSTNKRTYILRLVTSRYPAYLVKYAYPQDDSTKTAKNPLPCRTTGILNASYYMRGDKMIAPMHVWDDGRFTCMRFEGTNSLPVVYSVSPDKADPERGIEHVTNSHMEQDVMVIHQVSPLYRVRLGDQVLDIKTDKLRYAGYNFTGTTNNLVRKVDNGN